LLGQKARRDVAVAAIVPGPSQDQHTPATHPTLESAGNGTPRGLHQCGTRVPALCRGLVGAAHFGRGEQRSSIAQPPCQVRVEPRRAAAMLGHCVTPLEQYQPDSNRNAISRLMELLAKIS
jgi:hypothetical protein